eukprot:TRINITY_DN471_c1_g2_i1.p1 TRINITY_DN471_c1_g2~~TRINITY_DN471_c1_g2_i1.p1  ORF type:complete len:502 (-),score=81.50 TRINITY_DN471_c1_g2_i1:700-2205(-)
MASLLRPIASRALVRGSRGVFQSRYLSNARTLASYYTQSSLPAVSTQGHAGRDQALRRFATDGAVPSDGVTGEDTARSPVSTPSTSTITSSSTDTGAATDNVDEIVGDSLAGTRSPGPATSQGAASDSIPLLTPALHSIDSVHEEFVIPKERTVRSILSPFFEDVENNPRALALLTVFITKTSGDVAALRELVEEGYGLWEQVYRRVTSICTEHPQPMGMLEDLMTEDLLSACEKVFTEPSANTSVVKGKGKNSSPLQHVIDLAGFAVRDLKLELEFPVLRDFVLNEKETRPYRYCIGPLEFSVPVPIDNQNPSEWFLLTTLWQQLAESADVSGDDRIEPAVCKLSIGIDIFVSEYVAKEKSALSLSFEEIKKEHSELSNQGLKMVTGAAWGVQENSAEAKEQMAKAEKLSERMDVITEKFWGDMKGVLEQRVSAHQWTLQYDLKEPEEDRFWRICSMRNNVRSMENTAREFLLQPSHAALWHSGQSEQGEGGRGSGGHKA